MLTPTELYSFTAIILLMIISPGANQVLVLQSGLVFGRNSAALNVIGVACSMFVHATLSGLGISLLIMNSPQLYTGIKWLGVGYLAYLGISSMAGAYRLSRSAAVQDGGETTASVSAEPSHSSFLKGFNSNILNVQTAFVFLSIFPQYMHAGQSLLTQSLLLTLIFVGLLLTWYTLFILLIAKIRRHLLQPKVQAMVKASTGSLLLLLAISMLLKAGPLV